VRGEPGDPGEEGTLNGRGGHGGHGGRGGMALVNGLTWLIVALLAVVCVATGGLAVALYTDGAQPPVQFTSAQVLSVDCARSISYATSIRYRQAPVVVMSVRSVFGVADQRTIVFDTSPRYTSMLIAQTYTTTASTFALTTPLPPGDYELRIGVQTQTSRAAFAVMPFRCDAP
jgi:hypothetical protein